MQFSLVGKRSSRNLHDYLFEIFAQYRERISRHRPVCVKTREPRMILLGLGGNLPSAAHGSPQATLSAALAQLDEAGVRILRRSPWYRSAPVPAGDQPWFVNAVAVAATALPPPAVLDLLHQVERGFGRIRRERNEARPIDLDLLAYNDIVTGDAALGTGLVLPHPRLQDRAFVLLPLRDVAPDWRHPATGATLDEMIAALPPGQQVERMTP